MAWCLRRTVCGNISALRETKKEPGAGKGGRWFSVGYIEILKPLKLLIRQKYKKLTNRQDEILDIENVSVAFTDQSSWVAKNDMFSQPPASST